ncbi:MAG TPA: hypothetical protein ENI87_06075 [bacterium]|nr:hypothetical protein [bacterium]
MPAFTPPPRADGHYVLVVEGDRNHLGVTFARHKAAPWAGVPKGFASDWHLRVLDAAGAELAVVPLDVRPFATRPEQLGQPAQVHGCIVVDSRIGMLVNVPAFGAAARYEFRRAEGQGPVVIGEVDGDTVRRLCEGGK